MYVVMIYLIFCRGSVVNPTISFESSKLDFGTVPVGEYLSISLKFAIDQWIKRLMWAHFVDLLLLSSAIYHTSDFLRKKLKIIVVLVMIIKNVSSLFLYLLPYLPYYSRLPLIRHLRSICCILLIIINLYNYIIITINR